LINKTIPIFGTRQGSRYTLIEKLTKMQHLQIIFALAKRVSTGKQTLHKQRLSAHSAVLLQACAESIAPQEGTAPK
jgi:hypothetical protein